MPTWIWPSHKLIMSMEDELMSLCEGYIRGHSSQNAAEIISSSILDGKADILELIHGLGVYLTSTDIDTRCSGTELLSVVLGLLSTTQSLLSDDVHYLVQFYCDRLKDRAVIIPQVLAGLHALVTGQEVKQEDALLIFRNVFKEVYCQSLQFEERHKVFAVFLTLLSQHLPVLVEHSEEFVLGYIQLLDGEQDPRNLLIAFSSVLIIIRNLRFDSLAEDLFDVISCYFPIDFSPPPNDPMAVSRDALVQGLRQCLSASPKFAEMCIPLLLEKLSSDVLSAKLDSLHTLVAAALNYGPVALEPFLEPLWTAIKKEMFHSSSKEVQLGCVAAVRSIALSLSQPLHGSHLQMFIGIAIQDCQRHLSEPELKLMEPVVQLLCGITMASDPAAMCVVPQVFPLLLQQYSLVSHVSQKKFSVLTAIHSFIRATTTCAKDVEAENPLVEFKESLMKIVLSALNHTEVVLKKMAIAIVSDLLSVPNLLTDSEVIDYSQQLKNMALTDGSMEIQESIGLALQSMCKSVPELAKKHLTSPLLLELASNPSGAWLLAMLSSTSSLAASVLPSLISVLQQVMSDVSDHEEAALSAQYWDGVFSIATALQTIIERNAESALLTPTSLVLLSHQATNAHWKCCNAEVSKLIGIFSSALSLNTRHATERWCSSSLKVVTDILIVEPSSTLTTVPPTCLCLPLLTALLAAAPSTTISDWSKRLRDPLLDLSVHHATLSRHAVVAYAAILNKCSESGRDVVAGWVNEHMTSLWNAISPHDGFDRPLTALIWMTKALVMRGHELGLPAAHKLLEFCTRSDRVGALAADGFKLILSDCKGVLNRECHANIKLFYKQQLFVNILPKLMQKILMVEEYRKQHLLRALAHFLVGVPQQAILGELPKVLPLLLESLASTEIDVKTASLNGVLFILTDTPQSLSSQISSLLPCLLSLASDQSSMVIRRKALQCIEASCSLPTHLLYPHRRQVIRHLALCLDDHKRLVRKAAVTARAKWFLL